MCIWTSSVLLATLLVSGLSLPHPHDAAYKIPDVTTGGRAQFYVLHRDGTFKYGYGTGDGAYETGMSQSVGSQTGSFGYRTPDGQHIHLEYEAGVNGFVARGDHLPVPSQNLANAMAAVVRKTEPFVDPLAGQRGDASYNFGFDSDVHSRSETSDSDGTVTGSYSYVDETGTLRKFTYRAGKGIGFEITGEGLTLPTTPVAATRHSSSGSTSFSHGSSSISASKPSVKYQTYYTQTPKVSQRPTHNFGSQRTFADANIRSSSGDDGSYSFSYDNGDHSRSESGDSNQRVTGDFSFVAADDGQRRSLSYEAGSETGFIVDADHLPVGPSVPGAADGKPSGAFARYQDKNFVDPLANTASDSSYQFGFDSDTYSRSETADKDGNVVGSYTVVEEDGTRVTNQFKAGKGIGFEITDVSRSTGPRPTPTRRYQQSAGATVRASTGSHGARASQTTRTGAASPQYSGQTSFRSGSSQDSNLKSSTGDNGAYSFSYDAGTHHRSESGSDGTVRGDFSFVAADDGKRRSLSYEAGSETGFIVDADHLPVGPSVPGAADGKPSGAFARYQDKNFVDPLANTASDSSYQFGFDSDTYSRSETADKDGNVVGSYTIVQEDGTRVKNQFKAGKGIGFEITDVSRSSGPRPTPARSHQHSTGSTVRASSHSTGAQKYSGQTSFRAGSSPEANIKSSTGPNGAYSFSYDAGSHHRTEAGSDGKVTGDFSFVAADDGKRRQLEYVAGADTGFIVSGDHLPVGPVVPGAADGKPSGAFARRQNKNFVDPLAASAAFRSSQTGSSPITSSRHGISSSSNLRTQAGSWSYKPSAYSTRRQQSSVSSAKKHGSTVQKSEEFTLHTYKASPDADKFGYVINYH